jgi:hypothetical protein
MESEMADVYEQHRASFGAVSAYVIARDGVRVATIAFKSPRDGAGRLLAYVHWLGTEMVRGWASGCGYDKRSAACASAAAVWQKRERAAHAEAGDLPRAEHESKRRFFAAIAKDDGTEWHNRFRDAGFTVWQAV